MTPLHHTLQPESLKKMNIPAEQCLVSACLTGLCTRYDGESKTSTTCLEFLQDKHWIPICPEQLGGLPTPRPAADIVGGDGFDVLAGNAKVIDSNGNDLTSPFIRGAEMVLTIAGAQGIRLCCLKARSPSCAVNDKPGVLAALLMKNDIEVLEFDA